MKSEIKKTLKKVSKDPAMLSAMSIDKLDELAIALMSQEEKIFMGIEPPADHIGTFTPMEGVFEAETFIKKRLVEIEGGCQLSH